MTNTNKTADQIANDHGCDLHATTDGTYQLTVQGRWQLGWPQDDARIAGAKSAIAAAGHALRWYQLRAPKSPTSPRTLPRFDVVTGKETT